MKYIFSDIILFLLLLAGGCAADSADEKHETKPSEVKVDIPKEKQDEVAAKFKAGNFSKK